MSAREDTAGATQAELLALATALAHEAGELLSGYFDGAAPLSSRSKDTPTDLVGEADLAAEALLRQRLAAARPDDGLLAEEGGEQAGTSGLRWVVDPLDGTINFLHGIPQWCVSIACEYEGETIAGVVHDVPRGETFAATLHGDATLNGEPIRGSGCVELARALVGTGFAYDAGIREREGALVARVLPHVADIRRAGSAALDLAWTACGRLDAFYERSVKPWDMAAGALICARAGLELLELPPSLGARGGLIAAPPALARALTDLIAP